MIVIRPGRPADGVVLREIERLAGERFREVGMGEVADDEPLSLDTLASYAARRRSWVAVATEQDGGARPGGPAPGSDPFAGGAPARDDGSRAGEGTTAGEAGEGSAPAGDDVGDRGTPVGYLLVDVVDGCAHVEQVSVRPDHQGMGVGRALMDRARAWAVATRRPAVTLTTFANVPWNRPLYEHLGFRVMDESEIGPELQAVRWAEAAHGLDPATRACMRLDVEGLEGPEGAGGAGA
jgi:ribosomal protein S18 acetylase RimI-like enzyme